MCLDAGLKVPEVAQSLQVTERTVYAWFSGKTAVPYSAYKLLRVLNRFELPGWPGWHMHSGKLWTPEGFAFEPQDGAWWSLLVRQARAFKKLYARSGELERTLAEGAESLPQTKELATPVSGRRAAPGPAGAPAGRRAAPPNLFQSHVPTQQAVRYVFKGQSHA
ncbi:VC1465 family Xer recombination activation factor [Variovorax paradoxus]|uniref:VC1465 family Xer recombination activation factor n=1 Tax=Variovorax paradoxus TaxID=34073 RepID=UPI00286AEC49|nr:VC1465 family Xer recombination activation factor [Variovorax paradoxus]